MDPQSKYYIRLIWWILKIAILVFLLIPGSIPMIVGFLLSIVYTLLDPELIILNYAVNMYRTSIMTWSLLTQILFFNGLFLLIVLPYLIYLRHKHRNKNIIEISKYEIGNQMRRLKKPDRPRIHETGKGDFNYKESA